MYSQAITRVVAASGGKLNWDVRKDVSSWNCVTVAGAGANFSVKFGFKFSSPVDLADLVQIFGAKLASLDVANQPKLKGGSFDAWGCRGITGKFLGSLFREKSYESFRENSLGDIAVLANCKSLSVFSALNCRGITGKFLSDRSVRSRIVLAHESFLEKS